MSVDQMMFWMLSLVAIVGARRVQILKKERNESLLRVLRNVNHILFVLLPLMVLLHIGDYFEAGSNGFERFERIVFPVYLWALLSHLVVNWSYFQNKDFE